MLRALTAQLGLHSLLCHALGLRALQPPSIHISRGTGAVCLGAFDTLSPPPAAPAAPHPTTALATTPAGHPAPPLPFRLTRNLRRVAGPFGLDGAFSATFCNASWLEVVPNSTSALLRCSTTTALTTKPQCCTTAPRHHYTTRRLRSY